MKNVFLLGRWAEPQWEVMGIFPDLKTSLKHLKDGYFAVELPFNELYSEDKMEVVSYQVVEGKIWLIDIDGTMLEEIKSSKDEQEVQELIKEDKYPPCDTCGKELDYMPWHYSENNNRHLHSCDECWKDIKKRIYKEEINENIKEV